MDEAKGFPSIRADEASERRRESEGVAGVPVIRAGRTLSDRNGAIIRGSRDVKRSALCARRPCEKVAARPPIRFRRHRPKYRSPYNLTSNYSSLMPRECFYRASPLSLSSVFSIEPLLFPLPFPFILPHPAEPSNFSLSQAIILSRLPAIRRRQIAGELSESGPAFENAKLSVQPPPASR